MSNEELNSQVMKVLDKNTRKKYKIHDPTVIGKVIVTIYDEQPLMFHTEWHLRIQIALHCEVRFDNVEVKSEPKPSKWLLAFKIGDWIRNKKPYKGEGAKLIIDIEDDMYYICGLSANKYSQEANMRQLEKVQIEDQDNYELLPFKVEI